MAISPVLRVGTTGILAAASFLFHAPRAHAGSRDLRTVTAAERRDATGVRALVGQHADVNAAQPDGATALHWAAHWDDVAIARTLVTAGARVDAVNDYGVTPLSLAA